MSCHQPDYDDFLLGIQKPNGENLWDIAKEPCPLLAPCSSLSQCHVSQGVTKRDKPKGI